jgi:ACS family hexuronate transporter-like MFS transporter
VCGLLLLATTVNYMDRLTLNQMSGRIIDDFHLSERNYGQLESVFGVAFALGAVFTGWLADRWNVRWVYPVAVLVWSLAGFLTGLAHTFAALLVFRFLLGLAESGHWPCGLRTTQHILPPQQRTLGNSLLQSGAALGSVLTPPIVVVLYDLTGTWRPAFLAVGALGIVWVIAWLGTVRRGDLDCPRRGSSLAFVPLLAWLLACYGIDLAAHFTLADRPWLTLGNKLVMTVAGFAGVAVWLGYETRGEAAGTRAVFWRRFVVLAVLVVCTNVTWHFFRAWLPRFLERQHGYTLKEYNYFSMAYYLAADVGSLGAGFATVLLTWRGLSVHTSRVLVYALCAAGTCLSVVAATLPAGWLLMGLLLVIGFAALGVFPSYYSLTQELTVAHQGKLTGSLSCICWMSMSLLHELVGTVVEETGSYSQGVACAGLIPLVGLVVLVLFWGKAASLTEVSPPPGPVRPATTSPGSTGIEVAVNAVVRR